MKITGNTILTSATAINNTTTGQNLTSYRYPNVLASNWIILKTTATGGTTVTQLVLTIKFTK